MARIGPALRLIRLPGGVSAGVDSLTSALCTAVVLDVAAPGGPALATVAASSFALYTFGIVEGDLADVDKDRALHPARPLPAGEVSRRTASRLRWLALLVALATAAAAGNGPLVWASAAAALILLHQRVVRHTPFGPLSMAACRVANHGMGAALVAGASPTGWPIAIPALAGAWVVTLTALSDHEEPRAHTGRAVPVYLVTLLSLSLLPLAAVPARGLALIAVVPLFLRLLLRAGAARASAAAIGPVVGAAVKGLLLIDAAFLLGFGQIGAGLIAVAIWVGVEALGRVGLRT